MNKINKFPCLIWPGGYDPKVPGQHIIKGPLTGWLFTDTVTQVDCPRCGCSAGYSCQTPKGRKTEFPHTERMLAFNVPDPSVYTRPITRIDSL